MREKVYHERKWITTVLLLTFIILIAYSTPIRGSVPSLQSQFFHFSDAAAQADFSQTLSSIKSAYSAVRSAESSGGNVSMLVSELNVALALEQRAESENSTSPAQATIDLQNATRIAEQVQTQSSPISASGSAQKQLILFEAIGYSSSIIIAAVVIYVYGDVVYRRIWFHTYKDFTVRRTADVEGK